MIKSIAVLPSTMIPTLSQFDASYVFEVNMEGEVVVVEFDPNVLNMRLPAHVLSSLLDRLEEEGIHVLHVPRLMVNCESIFSIKLGTVAIRETSLVDAQASIVIEGEPFCELLLSGSPDMDHLVVGRQLIESVSSIILDNRDNQIGFVLLEDDRQRPINFPIKPLIPVFTGDCYTRNNEAKMDIVFGPTDLFANGVVLAQHSPRPVLSRTEELFSFIAIVPDGNPGVSGSVFEGHWQLESNPTIESDGCLVFSFDQHDVGQVVVVMGETGVGLLLTNQHASYAPPYASLDQMSLPDPTVHDDEEAACSICLDSISRGETVQYMDDCPHMFHLDCVRDWLEQFSRSCPLCRSVIALQ
jgi:hypothetical protein